ncbi:major facilitator superfamily domain-containing protein [Aspergillus pseudonomiae]|uniref:Major facilitator superfamily domain-containing protein n=1 Tax=Aspergillus pseudonomiae TaxID=1506151 RepID=A0A5N7DR75_9EURO|nr:major facilitator superfamily domain-containing protein [Aspergillus pseudonomiae]KAE8408951.1 major facilitator superfamily domain-containing protein [Aspergillus pseudonomiae]
MFGKEDIGPFADPPQKDGTEHVERNENAMPRRILATAAERARRNINAKLANPLAGYSYEELRRQGINFAVKHHIGDEEDIRAFGIGAILAQVPEKFTHVPDLRPDEIEVLQKEFSNRWSQPWTMYLVIALCSLAAAVQGMDETVVNGAQIFYKHQFGIGNDDSRSNWLVGLVNSAPYLCCAVIGCWLTVPFNAWFGRRGTIFITCCFSALACLWQGFVNTWWHMFIARFVLGFGIGPKSATVPIYAAETAPPVIRVRDPVGITGLNWRLMVGSAMLPAILVCCFVFTCPESPRWYMARKCHDKAYRSMCSLRFHKIQAARDLFYMHTLLEAENGMKLGQNKVLEMITVPRNRRALVASELVMFLQQIFLEATNQRNALTASLGWGLINWLFAIPAVYTIDTFGRRNLLLTTFPLMALSMFFTGFSFWIPQETHSSARLACIALGLYFFGIVYSVGEGPVPFTYSAEAYPLYIRSYGMALATATTWLFNFTLAVTWPSLRSAFTPQGAFSWYAGWNIVGWWLILLLMPETKGKTLEELDQVFSVSTTFHAAYGLRQIPYFFQSPVPQQQTPVKSFQNGVRTTGRAFHSPNWRVKGEESPSAQSAGSPGPKTNTSRVAFSRPSPHVPQAISEGRRLYVGNMPYTAKSEDVQALFTAAEFPIERIDIAIDPFTGRNPSYCFVDLESKELAEKAMNELDGRDMLGRPVKIKPGVVKSSSERSQQQQQQRTDGSPRSDSKTSLFTMDRWRRSDAPTFARTNSDSSRRLYVGGLPRLTDQEDISSNITNFFKDYKLENVSKLFTPHPAKRFEPGDHYYLFVDFGSVEEAQSAMNALNGQEGPWGNPIRVQRARGETNSEDRKNKCHSCFVG